MLQLGVTLLMLWNSLQFGFTMPQDGALATPDMAELCFGIDRRILCDCDPADTDTEKASCALFYNPPLDDPIWIQIGLSPTLTELKIYSRPEGLLTSVPTRAFNPDKLTDVKIEYANISVIPPFAFRNSTAVMFITLSHNKIQSLEPYAFAYLSSLRELALTENAIKIIKKNTFMQLSKLEILMLDRNAIEVIEDGAFAGLHHLQELGLNGNSLPDLKPGLFKGLSSLKNLDLASNTIRHLRPNYFTGLPKVRVIDLRENLISSIDSQTFEGLPNLMKLYLSRNRLANLHEDTFKPLASLDYLDLRHNNLKTLTKMTIASMNLHNASNAYLLVTDNDFVCDCRLRWMLQMSAVRSTTEWTTVKCLPPGDGGGTAFDTGKPQADDFNARGEFFVQANEKHSKQHYEILLPAAKVYLENCPDILEEKDLDKSPRASFATVEKDGLVDTSEDVAMVESVSLGLTKASTIAPDTKVTNDQTTQSLAQSYAFNRRNMIAANVLCCLLLLMV